MLVNRRYKKNSMALLLLIMLIALGIGYAILTSNLSINGITGINNARWSVYFDNVQVNNGSVNTVTQAPTIDSSKTNINYSVTLNTPGDYYEFTVDVVNDGTIDAMIDTVTSTINGLSPGELPIYLKYSVTYIDGIDIAPKHILSSDDIETYKVRVEYNNDLDASQLPSESSTLNISLGVNYIQKDDTGIDINNASRLKLVSDYQLPTDSFLGGPINRNQIESIAFVADNNVESGSIGSFDVGENNDGTVMAWYKDSDNDGLYELKIGSSDGIVLTNTNSQFLFMNCINVESIDFSHFSTRGTTNMAAMFSSLYIDVTTGNTQTDYMKLSSLDVSRFDTSNVTDMNDMFRGCINLTTLDISGWNTGKVADMSGMFATSYVNRVMDETHEGGSDTIVNMNLREIKGIGDIDTSSVVAHGIVSMFGGCASIERLDLSKWNTDGINNLTGTFSGCRALKTINLSNWNTNNVTSMYAMFGDCESLTSINLSSFNTSKVTNMSSAFINCKSLRSLDLSSFNISRVSSMQETFALMKNVEIDLSGSSFKSGVSLTNFVTGGNNITILVKTSADKTLLDNKNFGNLTVVVK